MKNLKKLLAALVVVTLLATSMMPAFAAGSYTYTTQAQALYDLGLYKGSSTTTFEPDLGSALDRQQGVVMLIRLLGKESAALALSDAEVNATLIIFSDAKDLASWAKKQIAYAVLYKYVAGLPNGTFAPNNALSGKEYCTMLLRALGYTVDAAGYAGACYQLSNIGGITFSEAAKFNDKELIRDDMVGISYGVLKADYKATGKSIIETMVETKVVTEAKAIAAGVYNTKLEEDAKAAIAAYKAAPITNLTEIAAAEAKKAAADAAVAKIVVAATKTALQKEIDDQAAKIAAKKKEINDADDAEKAAIAAAETAVKAYESASIATTADVTAAEALGKTAEGKVALVKTEASKTAFLGRITAQNKKVADKKVDLANVADATAAVDAYLVAGYDTVEKIAEAERLGLAAEDKVAKIVDTGAKADLTKKINDRKALVAAKKIELNSASVAVTVDNFKVMKLVFSKAMNIDTINTTNIRLNDGAKTFSVTPSSSEDKKTFYLEYAQNAQQSDEIKVSISNVKDVNGVVLTPFEKSYTVKDITDPVVKSVQVVDSKSIRLITSEPVNVPITGSSTFAYFNGDTGPSANGIKMTIDGNIVWANVSQNYYKGYVQLDFSSPLAAGTRTLDFTGLRDFAGFATLGTFSFQIADDKAAPIATSAQVIAKNKIQITFNENIASANGSAYNSSSSFYVVEAGNNPSLDASKNFATSVSYKDNTVTLTLQNNLTLIATLGLDVYYNYVSDSTGNTVSTEAKLATRAIDETEKPTVASVNVKDNNTIIVAFSEKVQPSIANFKLLYTANKAVWASSASSIDDYDTANPDGKTFIVTFSQLTSSLEATNYILEIGSVKDASIRENEMDAKQWTIAVKDTKSPGVAVVTKKSISGTSFSIEVNFTEPMDSSYIQNKINYFIGKDPVVDINTGKYSSFTTVPLSTIDNVLLTTTDNKKVTITFTNVGVTSPYKFTDNLCISVLAKDQNGNTIAGSGAIGDMKIIINDGDPVTGTYAFDKAAINSVQAIATNKIRLTVKNDAAGNPIHLFANAPIDINGLDLVIQGTDTSVIGNGANAIQIIGATVSADGKTLDLTLNRDLNAYGKLIDTNGVEIGAIALATKTGSTIAPIKDRNGVSLSIPATVVTTDGNGNQVTTYTGYNVVDLIKPIQLQLTQADKNIQVTGGFDAVTKYAKGNITSASYVKLTFNETVKSKTGVSADMAQGIEIYIGTTKLTPGIHYYTVFDPNAARTESGASGTAIYIKFSSEGSKDKLLQDLSNLTVRISNASYIIDTGNSTTGNVVVPK